MLPLWILLLPLVVVLLLLSSPSRQSTNRSAAARGLSFPAARGISRLLVATSCKIKGQENESQAKEDDRASHQSIKFSSARISQRVYLR